MIKPFATQFYLKGPGVDQHTPQAAIPGQQVYCSIRSHRCCKHGELPATSHASGQTMCMCQMNHSIQTYVQRAPILPEACFDATNSHINATASFFGEESSALCPSITNLPKDSLNMASASASFYYDNLLVAHPYGPFYPGVDLSSAARRKNATRGTTSALKAWLYEHRKNPYPAKGEKIMLAFVTRMTLTQVSTWFANARRRLKKEKRMGWSLNDDEEESEYNLTTEKGNNEDDNNVDKDAEENLSYQCSTSDDNDRLNISNISDPEDQSYLKNKPRIEEQFLGLPLYASGREKNNVKQNDCKNVSGQTVRRGDSTAFNSTSNSERTTFYTSNEAETVNPTRHPSENGNFKTKIWSIIDIIGSSDNLNSASKSTGTCSSSHKIRTSSDSHLTLVRVDPSSYSTASTNQHTNDNF